MFSKVRKIFDMLDSKQKSECLILFILMIFGMFFEMVSVGAIIPAFSMISDPNFLLNYPIASSYVSFFGDGEIAVVSAAAFTIASLYLIKSIYLSFLAWYQTKFVFEFQAKISKRLFTLYLLKDYSFHIKNNSSNLIRNVANETTQLSNGAVLTGLNVLLEILVVVGLGIFLLLVEPLGALLTIICLSFTGMLFFFTSKKFIYSWGLVRQDSDGKRIQNIQQGLGGIKPIKLLRQEASFIEQYEKSNNLFANAARKQSFLLNIPRLLIELIAIFTLLILVIVLMLNGETLSSLLPTLGLFAAAAFRLMPSVNRILGNYQTLQYSIPVIDLISKELIKDKDLKNSEKKEVKSLDVFGELILKDVFFKYDDNDIDYALKKINIRINNGSMIGFIGESGSGKSTLVDNILGLLKPQKGSITIGDHDIFTNINKWQKNIGYVPQNIYLIDDTLRKNIAFGVAEDKIKDDLVINAIKLANLTDFIESIEEGLDMMVGERGVKLSGGQLQRIGIARALYNNPSILILDEATSALDTDTESHVMKSITEMKGKRTIIIIAHRLTTVQRCDYLYELSNGKIKQQGTPNDIII